MAHASGGLPPNPKVTLPSIAKSKPSAIPSATSGSLQATAKPVAKPTAKLSTARLDPHKFSSPFAGASKAKTPFAEAYARGDIPCRIEHHTSRMSLLWTAPVEQLDYNPLLPLCFEGLRETTHPHTYISRQAVTDLLTAEGARTKVIPLLERVLSPLRLAVLAKEDETCQAAFSALGLLSATVGEELNPHVHHFLSTLNKRLGQRAFREQVEGILRQLEENGGPTVSRLIKQKIPTYTPLHQ